MNSYIRQSAVPADQMHSFLKDKQAWENAIAVYQGPDPLDHWWNYICWYENHVHGDPDNKFRETLERCLTLYEHSDYYKQDVRMVRLWLKYIDMQNNPLHFYQVLHQRGLGKQVACFYIGWALYYESVNAFKEAEAVYNLAFQEKAQPYAELHHGHSKLIYNKTMHVQAQQQQQHLQLTQHSGYQHQQQHPVALQSTNSSNATVAGASIGSGHENIHQSQVYRQQVSYHSIAQHNYHHQQQQQQSLHIAPTSTTSLHHGQTPIAPQHTHLYHHQSTVHNLYPPQTQQLQDASHHIHGLSHPLTSANVLQVKDQLQEVNTSTVYSTQHSNIHHSHQQESISTQNVLQQQNENNQTLQQEQHGYSIPIEQQLPAVTANVTRQHIDKTLEVSVKRQVLKHNQQPNSAREIEVTGIKLPKKFSSMCSNNHETWQPALFLEEPDDPQKVCHYAKSAVYPPNLGVEFSPEEIKARRFKYKMNELSRNSEAEQRRSREERQAYHQSAHDHYEKDSKGSGTQNQQHLNSQMQEIGTIKKESSKYQQQQQQHQYYVQHQQMPLHNINNNNMYYEQQQNHEAQTQYQQEQHQPTIQHQSNQQQYHINHYDQERYQQKLNSRQHEQLQHCYKDYESDGDPEEDEDEDDNDNDNQDTEDEQLYSQQHSHQNHRHQIHHQYHPQSTSNQQNMNSLDTEGDLEDQIEASTIRFSMHTPNKGSQNKTLKIKFKKERPQTGSDATNGNNYSAYTIERIYQTEIESPSAAENIIKRNGNNNSFHPYLLGQTSTPKTSVKRQKTKLKKPSNKFQMLNCTNSNSSSAENGHSTVTQKSFAAVENRTNNNHTERSVHNATFNDNANYSFSSAVALDNSNCSLSNAVGRLNFRDVTALNSSTLNQTQVADISTYQENSYFSTQNDDEAKERRLSKALETIERHMAKEAIDPFSSELCRAFLTKLDFPGANGEASNNYKIIQTPLPKIANARQLNLTDGIQFNIDKEIGRGSYGSVYKATDLSTGAVVALKFQKPANTWEIYICDQVLKRIKSPNILPGLMDISTAIIAPNASLIATEFSPYGSLLDINNKIRQATTKVMHESLVMHFSAQICNIIHHLHQNKIIHADIKPDNFLLMRVPSTDLHFPSLRLIDFGCAIDMTLFPEGDKTKFRKVIQTDGFTCIEMQEGRSWSYETDLFCIAGTVHVMLFGEYMQLQKRAGAWDVKQKLPRYLKKHVWSKFFIDILNIKPTKPLPDLSEIRNIFEEEASKMDSELQKQMRTLSNILHRR